MKKLSSLFNTFVHWVVFSSIDPGKASLTIKGFLVGAVPLLMFLLGAVHLNVGQEDLNVLIDSIAAIVQLVISLIALVMMMLGMLRKIINTFFVPNE